MSNISLFEEFSQLEHLTMHNELCPMVWHSAKNDSVFDKEGNKWIDFTSAIAVANGGHGNSDVLNAIREVLDRPLLATFNYPHEYRLNLLKKVRDLFKKATGADYKAHFLSSGTEAVECALDLAIQYKGKNKSVILSLVNEFHGNTLQSDSLSGKDVDTIVKRGETITYYIKVPNQNSKYDNNIDFVSAVKLKLATYDLKIEDVVAVLLEPYQGRGVFVHSEEAVKSIAKFCSDNNILLIVDEIQSGFYRTGKLFCFENYNLIPDIVCLGKGLSSSLPISAVVAKDVIFDKTKDFEVLTTHSGNPLSCAASLANIKHLESNEFQNHLKEIIPIFESESNKLKKYECVKYVKSFGMVTGCHIVQNEKPNKELARKIVLECFKNGLILNAPNGFDKSYLRFTPPLSISKHSLKKGFDILNNVLNNIQK